MSTFLGILLALLALVTLIVIHEFGHFIAAKIFNVYVNEFSIGFGPLIFSKKRKTGETKFSIRWIPLGGYCSMIGEDIPEMTEEEEKLLTTFREKEIPCIIAYTKSDLLDSVPPPGDGFIYVSAKEGMNINELKEMVGRIVKDKASRPLVEDLVEKGDVVVLVIPIDSSAPKGRLILPQQMMMRSLLDAGAIAVAVQPEELPSVLSFVRPRLVITDSQAFSTVSRMVPEDIPMTSFSILMARYKGELDVQLDGVSALGNLKKGDKVLIAEGCTHHRQCEDIGTVKIPKLVSSVAEGIEFEFSSGHGFPENLSEYSLIIHCGACMLTEKEMKSRIGLASDAGVPVTNYGMALAYFNGILSRALKPLGIDVHNDRR